ncbi:unnamed protein product, partial [Musa hybrid cultivar]
DDETVHAPQLTVRVWSPRMRLSLRRFNLLVGGGKITLTHRTLRPLCCSPSSKPQLLCFTSHLLASPPPSTRSTLAAKEVELAHLCPDKVTLIDVQRTDEDRVAEKLSIDLAEIKEEGGIAADAEDDLKETSDGHAIFSSSQDRSQIRNEQNHHPFRKKPPEADSRKSCFQFLLELALHILNCECRIHYLYPKSTCLTKKRDQFTTKVQ